MIIGCRHENEARKAVESIIKDTGNHHVQIKRLNLRSFKAIRKFAAEIHACKNFLFLDIT